MVYTLRHLIFRTWATVLVGVPFSLLVLPAFHARTGLQWALYPVVVILVLVFMVIGWFLNRFGMNSVERLMEEATAWERTGALREAEKAFQKAVAVLDSVLLSPLVQKRESGYLAARLARFYLARVDKNHASEAFIISYLQSHPEDEDVAENWLQQVESQGGLKKDHYELVSRIGSAQPKNITVQRLLARFYLAAHRTDFPALQTYRYVLNGDISAATDIVNHLAALFIKEGRADDWALQVYLQSFKQGGKKSQLLKGIAACVHWIQETGRTRRALQEARTLLGSFDEASLEKMRAGFSPPHLEPVVHKVGRKIRVGSTLWKLSTWIGSGLFRLMTSAFFTIIDQSKSLFHFIKNSRRSRLTIEWSIMAVLVVGVVVLVVNTAGHLIKTEKALSEKKELTEVVVTDPFTIQVAAYLRPEDAQRYVRYLKDLGLDAYWKKRRGTKKTYYRVRVSHFADKPSARAYGASLKAQGIIDDFYVANYERP